VQLGAFNKTFTLVGGVPRHSGLRNVALHNVTVGDDCLVEDVHEYIANYNISNGCRISNVDIIVAPCDRTNDGRGDVKPRFGNGIEVTVVNEAGGREVTIHNRLSAQQAYIQAMYRYRPKTVENLKQIIKKYVATIDPNRGEIGECATITDCGTIREVNIGSHATLRGAKRLTCGSINSNVKAPVTVGDGVIADEFIISSGSHVDEGALLTRCFVGQACHIGRGFSAVDSLFFSNCHMENGEACSLFAGPYTVSHHKSTLLIAGLFSFMNAGSGTNQSNHGYRMGPMYQGVMERGCKTASDSYVLWPAHIGAFTLVKGRHTCNPDTAWLPFSYLLEKDGETCLVPGINLSRVGTYRDAAKWKERDGRTDDDLLDILNFDMLNPYTMDAIMHGMVELSDFINFAESDSNKDHYKDDDDDEEEEEYDYDGMSLRLSAAKKGEELYRFAFYHYACSKTFNRLIEADCKTWTDVRECLECGRHEDLHGGWVDMAGMVAPFDRTDALVGDLAKGKIKSLGMLEERFADIEDNYDECEWQTVCDLIKTIFDKTPDRFDFDDFQEMYSRYCLAASMLGGVAFMDAEKDFVDGKNKKSAVPPSYGVDCSKKNDRRDDFLNVHGSANDNPALKKLMEPYLGEIVKFSGLLNRIKKMKK
jgi:hypothetical protein